MIFFQLRQKLWVQVLSMTLFFQCHKVLLNHWMNYAIFLQNDVFDLESGNGRVASVYGFSIFLPTPPVVFSRSAGVCDRHNNDDARVVCGNWIYLAALLGTLAAMIWQLIICSQQQQLSFYFALLFMHDFFRLSVLLLHFHPFLGMPHIYLRLLVQHWHLPPIIERILEPISLSPIISGKVEITCHKI